MEEHRSPTSELLGFLQEKGHDLELKVAAVLKDAGFTISQSVGVTDFAGHHANVLNELSGGGPGGIVPEHDGREVDVVASCSKDGATVAFIVECKSLRRGTVAALELAADDRPHEEQQVTINGNTRGVLIAAPAPLRLEYDCRAYKLVGKADRDAAGARKDDYDPIWNALRQVLDVTDDAETLELVQDASIALRIPLLVVDAPFYAVGLDTHGQLTARAIGSALLRVAVHKKKVLREVSVVSLAALETFARQAFKNGTDAAVQLARHKS